MQQLAPVVDAHTNERERVLVSFFGEQNSFYHSQLLWYTNRFSEYLIQPAELQEKLQLGMSRGHLWWTSRRMRRSFVPPV